MTFTEMGLISPLLLAIKECGYEEPTPIQQATIPIALSGKDVLGCAQTGTGKSAAFILPILQRLSQRAPAKAAGMKKPIRALVLTPTRELAQQIYESFHDYGKKLPFKACVVFGGVAQRAQTDALQRGVDILVATPGRLCDLIEQGFIDLGKIEFFVLDEADRMLDMGFIHDVRRVLARLPAKRQTLFFSATMPPEVESLAMSILHDPVTVKVDPVTSTVERIEQSLYYVDKANKKYLLAHLLSQPQVENALVFVRTRHGADRVVRELSKAGIRALAIHGDKSQNARQAALNQFKSGEVKVLIATDIAARGIDIIGLSHVINHDLPNEPESYIHRIGRTGRAGLTGEAISFCCFDEMKNLYAIEKLIGKRISVLESQWPMVILTPTIPQPRPPRPKKLQMDGNAPRQPRQPRQPRSSSTTSNAPEGKGQRSRRRRRP